jgi:signal transduction histidine kinase
VTGNALANVDVILFRRAVTNPVSNAFQYTPDEGTIGISVVTTHGEVKVSVVDSGIGIEETDLRKVMHRFFRTEKTRSFHPYGTGLGLAIVKSITDLHGGRVAIESFPAKGTTVTLVFLIRNR